MGSILRLWRPATFKKRYSGAFFSKLVELEGQAPLLPVPCPLLGSPFKFEPHADQPRIHYEVEHAVR